VTGKNILVDSRIAVNVTVERVVRPLNAPYPNLGGKDRIDFIHDFGGVISNHEFERYDIPGGMYSLVCSRSSLKATLSMSAAAKSGFCD
jgi:hypothetical protein